MKIICIKNSYLKPYKCLKKKKRKTNVGINLIKIDML